MNHMDHMDHVLIYWHGSHGSHRARSHLLIHGSHGSHRSHGARFHLLIHGSHGLRSHLLAWIATIISKTIGGGGEGMGEELFSTFFVNGSNYAEKIKKQKQGKAKGFFKAQGVANHHESLKCA